MTVGDGLTWFQSDVGGNVDLLSRVETKSGFRLSMLELDDGHSCYEYLLCTFGVGLHPRLDKSGHEENIHSRGRYPGYILLLRQERTD